MKLCCMFLTSPVQLKYSVVVCNTDVLQLESKFKLIIFM